MSASELITGKAARGIEARGRDASRLRLRRRRSAATWVQIAARMLLPWGLALWPLGRAQVAGAAPSTLTVSLTWRGRVCGGPEGLKSRVAQRTSRIRWGRKSDVELHVELEPHEAGVEAMLRLGRGAAMRRERRLVGDDCSELLDAVALVVTIGLEAELDVRSRPPPAAPITARRSARRRPTRRAVVDPPTAAPPEPAPPEPAPPEPAPPEPAPPEPAPPEPAPKPQAPDPLLPPPVSEDEVVDSAGSPDTPAPPAGEPAPAPARGDGPSRWSIAALALTRVALGATPGVSWGYGGGVRVAYRGDGIWFPELGVEVSHSQNLRADDAVGAARFSVSHADAAFCPVGLAAAGLLVRPCGVAQVGELVARAREAFNARREHRPWSAAGLQLSARFPSSSWALWASLSLTFPLVRDRFRLDAAMDDGEGGITIFRVPPAVVGFSFGAGWGSS